MLRHISKPQTVRFFSVARAARVEHPSKTDSFKERETAEETAYIRKQEKEQLQKLRKQLDDQKQVVDKLEKELKDLKK